MRKTLQLALGVALATLTGTGAWAVPVTFSLNTLGVTGGSTPVATVLAGAPIAGSGNLVFDSSKNLVSGSLTLGNFTVNVDLLLDSVVDAQISTTNWSQTLAAASFSGGGVTLSGGTAGGSTTCTTVTAFGALVCPSVGATVLPFGSALTGQTNTTTLTLSSFVSPTEFAGTITSVTFDPAQGATTTLTYAFSTLPVPEPGTVMLLATGLLGLAAIGRRQI